MPVMGVAVARRVCSHRHARVPRQTPPFAMLSYFIGNLWKVRRADLGGMKAVAPAAAAFASAREHRRLIQKSVVVDLLHEEIRYVGARDEPACSVTRIDQRAIGVRLRPIG